MCFVDRLYNVGHAMFDFFATVADPSGRKFGFGLANPSSEVAM
jgi:hypothetical protein